MIVLVGRYRLVAPLGKGGMGTVWRAFDELLRQEVAVKEVRLPPELSDSARAELSERTLREARAAAKLRSHPSIVTVHDVVLENDRPWIVMELLQGRSLDQVVRQDGPLPPHEVANIGLALLDALSAAHGIGILHRDVKPANVLLTDDGRVVLTDFGIATVEGDTSLTQAGAVAGSPGYIAPERLRGETDTPGSDIWSLGATLYAAVEGQSPFARDNGAAIMAAVLMHEPDPMRNAGPLAPVLASLLEKDANRRCPPGHAAAQFRAVANGTSESVPPFRPVSGPVPGGFPEVVTPYPPNGAGMGQPTGPGGGMGQPTGPGGMGQSTHGAHHAPGSPRRPWLPIAAGAALMAALVGVGAFVLLRNGEDPGAKQLAANTPSSQPSSQGLFTEDPTACDLLEPSQLATRDLLGGRPNEVKETFQGKTACLWERDSVPAFIEFVIIRQADINTAHSQFSLMKNQMQDQIRTNKTTDLREAKTAGDETYSYTQKQQPVVLHAAYKAQVMVRTANIVITVDYSGPRTGYQTVDRAVQVILKALGTPH